MDEALEQVEGPHRITQRQSRVVRQTPVAIAQSLHIGSPILFRIAQVSDKETHQVVPELSLPLLGCVVES